ncbi:hypothetical protein BZG29_04340 [Janthinobacterium sp. LM6]|nr:hypothetical protein BZG29_04340 [Janthinobacterium sp. LM6]
MTVNGTAATGKAIAGAMIAAKCQTGTGNATTLADGSYSLAAAGGKLPCLLQITDPADGSKLHTLVLGSGSAATANITPLSEMLTARLLGSEPAVFFAAFDSAIAGNKITAAAVKAAQADVGAVLGGVVDTTPLADFLSTPLKAATQGNPAGGDAQDRLLDALRVKINAAQLTQVVAALAKIANTDAIKQVIADIAAIPPVAQAGPAQSVMTGTVVTLDGSASSADAGRTLSYAWTLQSRPAGSTASLSSPTSARPTFTADVAGTYVASVIVNDGKVSSNAAAVSITASAANAAPVANAGYAQNVLSGSVVELDGSASSDANGDVLTFAWKLTEKPANSTATLSSVNSARPTFTADASGLYVVKLSVNDGKASSADATVTVSASAIDTSGPVVSAITVNPTTVDVSQASQLVTATVTVTDATGINLNALPNPYWHSIADIGGTRIDSNWVLASGDAKHATFSSTVTIPAGAKAGSWTVGWTAFRDTLGYTSTNGGYDKSFTVQSNGLNDTSGPVVSAITVNPTTVDVSQASQLVTATVTVTDATGINLNALPNPYWHSIADIGGTSINSNWVLTSGDAKHATFSSTVTIPAGAKAGSWTVGWTAFRDTLGYTSTNGGYDKSFTVQSNGLNDTSGPVVSAITVNPTTVDVSQASQLVTATVTVTDATGINLNALPNPYWHSIADIGGTSINSNWVLVSGDAKHATFSSTVTIPAGAKAGSWTVGWTAFRDTLGYTSTNGGYDKSFTVK